MPARHHRGAARLRAAAPDLQLIDERDFRLRDVGAYESWCGEHFAPALQPGPVYELTEHYREDIRNAPIVPARVLSPAFWCRCWRCRAR